VEGEVAGESNYFYKRILRSGLLVSLADRQQ
jgi:hypothetical protein